MTLSVLAEAARTPVYLAGALAVLAGVLALVLRTARKQADRPPAAVVTAAFAALLCTAYSGDTSWRFARDHLGMASGTERVVMFAAAEVALFSMALMARQNLGTLGAPGTPGVLVWVVTGVQVIPAYSETGPVAGTVRAFFGPVCAALLWHLAMGIELRHTKPGEESQSLPAVLARELRERTLSRLGLSRRGRDAAQITRDRWTRIATQRAARLADLEAATARPAALSRARRRLAVAVDRTDAGVLDGQRAVLLDRLAAYRGAALLASMDLPAPWASRVDIDTVAVEPAPEVVSLERVPDPVPEAYPAIEAAAPGVPEAVPAVPEAVPAPVPGPEITPTPDEPDDEALTTDERFRRRFGDEFTDSLFGAETAGREPDDDSPPPPGEDNLTPQARRDYLADLMDQRTPSIRNLRSRYGIGQDRATRIQTELKVTLS